MALILAIEPDSRQAGRLKRLVKERVRAELVLVDSRDAAVAALAARVPDLILLSALLSPRDEEELMARLRTLDEAAYVQTLSTPLLAGARRTPERPKRGLLNAFKRKRPAKPVHGCDPAIFGEQIQEYLARAEELRMERSASAPAAAGGAASFGETRPPDDFASFGETSPADGFASFGETRPTDGFASSGEAGPDRPPEPADDLMPVAAAPESISATTVPLVEIHPAFAAKIEAPDGGSAPAEEPGTVPASLTPVVDSSWPVVVGHAPSSDDPVEIMEAGPEPPAHAAGPGGAGSIEPIEQEVPAEIEARVAGPAATMGEPQPSYRDEHLDHEAPGQPPPIEEAVEPQAARGFSADSLAELLLLEDERPALARFTSLGEASPAPPPHAPSFGEAGPAPPGQLSDFGEGSPAAPAQVSSSGATNPPPTAHDSSVGEADPAPPPHVPSFGEAGPVPPAHAAGFDEASPESVANSGESAGVVAPPSFAGGPTEASVVEPLPIEFPAAASAPAIEPFESSQPGRAGTDTHHTSLPDDPLEWIAQMEILEGVPVDIRAVETEPIEASIEIDALGATVEPPPEPPADPAMDGEWLTGTIAALETDLRSENVGAALEAVSQAMWAEAGPLEAETPAADAAERPEDEALVPTIEPIQPVAVLTAATHAEAAIHAGHSPERQLAEPPAPPQSPGIEVAAVELVAPELPAAELVAAEPAAVELAAIELAAAEPAAAEPEPVESATVEPAAAELVAAEPATVEPAAVEPAAVGPAAAELPAAELVAAEPAAVELAAVEPAAVGPAVVEPAARTSAARRAKPAKRRRAIAKPVDPPAAATQKVRRAAGRRGSTPASRARALQRLAPLSAWAHRFDEWELPEAPPPPPEHGDDLLRDLLAGLNLPPQVAAVAYANGCRIRRVRLSRRKAARRRSKKPAPLIILSRQLLPSRPGATPPA